MAPRHKLVYVAGPYRAPSVHQREHNIQEAWRLAVEVVKSGAVPVVPHMSTAHMDDLQDPAWWLDATLEVMRRCDAVVLIPGWLSSMGTLGEVEEAMRLEKPVFNSIEELKIWLMKGGE